MGREKEYAEAKDLARERTLSSNLFFSPGLMSGCKENGGVREDGTQTGDSRMLLGLPVPK